MSGPSVAVVLPVRDGADLLPDCLAAVLPQARALGAEVVVVDDASADGSAAVAERAGARVLRLDAPSGPYAARNAGWRSTGARLVAFTDVRCRPRPGWLQALVDADAVLAGGDVHAVAGRDAATRYVARQQPLSVAHSAAHPVLPYAATANLAVRRDALEAVGGFREVRSGGDLDLCWRVQRAGLGALVVVDGAVVDWQPREGLRAVLRQWYRYGAARPVVLSRFAGVAVDPPRGAAREAYLQLRWLGDGLAGARPGAWPVEVVDRLCQLAYWTGYRRSFRALGEAS